MILTGLFFVFFFLAEKRTESGEQALADPSGKGSAGQTGTGKRILFAGRVMALILIAGALSPNLDDISLLARGIDASYAYEGYTAYRAQDL